MKQIRWQPEKDGRLTESALRAKLEYLGYSVTKYVYPPGTVFPDHSHGVDKIDAVVSGRFKMIVEGKELGLQAGDMLSVARGIVHSAEVLGDEPVISLDGVRI
jgi:quercetin dioxygenase-like cupin family protein